MSAEKPAERPESVSQEEWNSVDALNKIREVNRVTIRRRSDGVWAVEVLIQENIHITKRMRELDPPLKLPADSPDDPSFRFHSLVVHDRLVRKWERRVHAAAAGAMSSDPTNHNLAVQALHDRKRARNAAVNKDIVKGGSN